MGILKKKTIAQSLLEGRKPMSYQAEKVMMVVLAAISILASVAIIWLKLVR